METEGNAIGILLENEVQTISQVISLAVIVFAILGIPYMISALIWKHSAAVIRNTYRTREAFYHPSLWFLTWLTRVNIAALIFVLGILFLRLALRYEVIYVENVQPYWSLALSGIASLVVIMVFLLPATFLFVVKRWILEDPDIDRLGKIVPESRRAANGSAPRPQ